ncbi:unnamed protein product [Diplocarpon coronariae]|nr:hypothetical protein JHW43_003068 [Diplocarpon mali]
MLVPSRVLELIAYPEYSRAVAGHSDLNSRRLRASEKGDAIRTTLRICCLASELCDWSGRNLPANMWSTIALGERGHLRDKNVRCGGPRSVMNGHVTAHEPLKTKGFGHRTDHEQEGDFFPQAAPSGVVDG